MQFHRVKSARTYLKEHIQLREFRRQPMPENIRKIRNRSIILVAV